jgi:hypothetical protein
MEDGITSLRSHLRWRCKKPELFTRAEIEEYQNNSPEIAWIKGQGEALEPMPPVVAPKPRKPSILQILHEHDAELKIVKPFKQSRQPKNFRLQVDYLFDNLK